VRHIIQQTAHADGSVETHYSDGTADRIDKDGGVVWLRACGSSAWQGNPAKRPKFVKQALDNTWRGVVQLLQTNNLDPSEVLVDAAATVESWQATPLADEDIDVDIDEDEV